MDQRSAFEIVREYINYLKSQDFAVQRAYIFGSYANGRFNENSDIDLAVVLRNVSNSFLMQVELMKISRKFDTRIEPHPFDEEEFDPSNPFANEILTKGMQIA